MSAHASSSAASPSAPAAAASSSTSSPAYRPPGAGRGSAGGGGSGGKYGTPRGALGGAGRGVVTPAMRDRQARGKDPYAPDPLTDDIAAAPGAGGSHSGASDTKMRLGSGPPEKESFAVVDRRRKAATVLDSPELLMMYAQSSGDSIPATRLRFTRIMCGYEDDEDDYDEDYDDLYACHDDAYGYGGGDGDTPMTGQGGGSASYRSGKSSSGSSGKNRR